MHAAPTDLVKAIGLKLLSALLFAGMSALIRQLSEVTPVGQIVFFRSACAIPPVLLIYAFRGELMSAIRTSRIFGHLLRGTVSISGMFTNFASLARLPLADSTAIQFVSPLITVALAAIILKERVRIYRWTAVAVGFVGVLVMLVPNFDSARYAAVGVGATAAVGSMFALAAAFCNAGAVIQTRRLTQTEVTSSIVFYFSLVCALAGLVTLPFAWYTPSRDELLALIATGILGGIAQIFMTESYRYAPASVIAPFDYTSLIWALLMGYWVFGELPSAMVYVGASIVAAAGLFVIWRERQLGIDREDEGPRPPATT